MNFVDETLSDLEAMISADFGRPFATGDAMKEMHAWLHYRARLIPQRQRRVVWSAKARSAAVRFPAALRIAAAFEEGRDVSPWLSNRVRLRKDDNVADLLFNDWQISHFHLSEVFSKPQQIRRRDHLLFAFVRASYVVMLDILPHRGSWTNQDLVRTLALTSPVDVPVLHDVIPPRQPQTDAEIQRLRSAHMVAPIIIGGQVFVPPGHGLVGSGSALRLVRLASEVHMMLRDVRQSIGQNRPEYVTQLAGRIGVPVTLGVYLAEGSLVAYEKNRRLALIRTRPME